MLHKLKTRIVPIVGAIVMAAGGIPLILGAAPALAYNCNSYCYDYGYSGYFLNAWNGGPYVKTDNNPYTEYGEFNVYATSSGSNVEIMSLGSNYSGDCVGDYNNDSTQADTGLDECPTSGDAGWGTNFQEYNCTDGQGDYGYDFYNNHWGGYLGFGGLSNGQKIYMNVATPNCFYPQEQVH